LEAGTVPELDLLRKPAAMASLPAGLKRIGAGSGQLWMAGLNP
jgi:hypothetical protein